MSALACIHGPWCEVKIHFETSQTCTISQLADIDSRFSVADLS
jgi:hypothetical protein